MPIGGGLFLPIFHPEVKMAPAQTEWTFPGDFVRMPEFNAPAAGNRPNLVTIAPDLPVDAQGVLYELGPLIAALPGALFWQDHLRGEDE